MVTNPHQDFALLRGPTQLARLFMRHYVRPGDQVVDATCGNGHDTLLLAELVGSCGKVWAFDIQEEALRATAEKLGKSGLSDRVKIIRDGHERMADHVPPQVRAVIFNLGYRPGGDRDITTGPGTTIPAIEQALRLLMPEGILAITVYPGHPGGSEEGAAISSRLSGLDQGAFHAWGMAQANARENAPYFLLIQKVE